MYPWNEDTPTPNQDAMDSPWPASYMHKSCVYIKKKAYKMKNMHPWYKHTGYLSYNNNIIEKTPNIEDSWSTTK